MWINQEVSDASIHFAEQDALTAVFPGFNAPTAIFRIVLLAPWCSEIQHRLFLLAPGPPLLPALPHKFTQYLTAQHPFTHFYLNHEDHNAEVKQDRYIDRVSKRPRL